MHAMTSENLNSTRTLAWDYEYNTTSTTIHGVDTTLAYHHPYDVLYDIFSEPQGRIKLSGVITESKSRAHRRWRVTRYIARECDASTSRRIHNESAEEG